MCNIRLAMTILPWRTDMRSIWLAVFLLIPTANASAHYHMLIPDEHSVKAGQDVLVTYQFGHPFEHQLFDCEAPASATIFLPDSKEVDVKAQLKKVEINVEKNKKVVAYRLMFKPEQRGDYVLVFKSPAAKIEGEKEPVYDTVKVIVHVQVQKNWDTHTANAKEQLADLVPLTRPYGLRPGMLFRAVFLDISKTQSKASLPVKYAEVEIERYNHEPPKQLPPDEHTTYVARTDEKGVVATTLPEAGWWAITAIRHRPNGLHRCTFWVFVDGSIRLKPAE